MSSWPLWLDEELISTALEGAKVQSMDITKAVAEEDHYFSTLVRLNVKYKRDSEDNSSSINLIVKSLPNGVMTDYMVEAGLMSKEVTMYRTALPLLESRLGFSVTAKFYDCKKDDVVIMEDLVSCGFRMENRIERLDFEHCQAAMILLAEWHAHSVLLQVENPHVFSNVGNEVLYLPDNNYMKSFLLNCCKVLGNEVGKWPELSIYGTRIRNAGEMIWVMMLDAVNVPEKFLKVLDHGDFWTNNILFRHDEEGAIKEVKVVDFQFTRWSTQSMDLQMFFNTSVRNLSDIPKLTACYLTRFNEILNPANICLTPEQLDAAIRRTDCYGLLATICLLPTCVLSADNTSVFDDSASDDDYEGSFQSDSPYDRACKDPNFRKILPEYIEHYVKRGLL